VCAHCAAQNTPLPPTCCLPRVVSGEALLWPPMVPLVRRFMSHCAVTRRCGERRCVRAAAGVVTCVHLTTSGVARSSAPLHA
jgi:hypothetical protein